MAVISPKIEWEGEDDNQLISKIKAVVSTLPRDKGWTSDHVYQYQGFWFTEERLIGTILAQKCSFKVRPTSILLATNQKCGTTWLKALAFSVFNRSTFSFDSHPLLSDNPHDCVPILEGYARRNPTFLNQQLPLICHTHLPYTFLPDSILASACKIVYLYRDPKDLFVSLWKFCNKLRPQFLLPPLSLKEAFGQFSKGVSGYGPHWDHVLSYWKARLQWPDRMLFLRYEELMNDPILHLNKLAEFIGQPFSLEEDQQGIAQRIIDLCSFENLSNLEVNKTGTLSCTTAIQIENKTFFRRGGVGDWKNHLTAEMAECLDRITEEKFKGTGLPEK